MVHAERVLNRACLRWLLRPHFKHHAASDLVSSWFVPSWALFVFRVISFVYTFTIFLLKVSTNNGNGSMFAYFTHLNFILLPGYFAVGAVLGLLFLSHRKALPEYRREKGCDKARLNVVELIYWIAFPLIAANALFLDIIYWAAVFGTERDTSDDQLKLFLGINVHAVNVVWMALELVLNRMDVFFVYFICPIAFGMTYLFVAWIYYAFSDEWVYEILDWSKPSNAFYYIILWPAGIACFLLVMGCAWLRNFLASKLKPRRRHHQQQKDKQSSKEESSQMEEGMAMETDLQSSGDETESSSDD
ncbi:hypothetical protein QOT17_004983 [Balamuthia mandrillaris]